MRAFLYRTLLQPEQTLGELQIDDFKCYTMELGWHDNAVRKSCIPDGVYPVIKHISPKFGKCFWIKEVPNRSAILIHPMNHHWHSLGCIGVGSDHLDINHDGLLDVVNSKTTMKKLLEFDITEIEIKTI